MYALLRSSIAKTMVVQLQLLDLWDCSPLNKMTTPWQPFYIQMLLSKPPETQVLADSMLLLVHDIRDAALQACNRWFSCCRCLTFGCSPPSRSDNPLATTFSRCTPKPQPEVCIGFRTETSCVSPPAHA